MQKASLYFFSNQVKLKKDIPPKVYVKFEITVDYQPEKITDLSCHVNWNLEICMGLKGDILKQEHKSALSLWHPFRTLGVTHFVSLHFMLFFVDKLTKNMASQSCGSWITCSPERNPFLDFTSQRSSPKKLWIQIFMGSESSRSKP